MSNGSADILSSMLGVKPATGKSPSGQATGIGSPAMIDGSLIFSDILGLLTNVTQPIDLGKANAQGTGVGTPTVDGETNLVNALLKTNLSGTTDPVWMLGRSGVTTGHPSANMQSGATVAANKQDALAAFTGIDVSDDTTNTGVGSTATSVQNQSAQAQASAATLFGLPAVGANVPQMLTSIPTELKTGTYQVLSSNVENGTVNLVLKSPDQKSPIQVSIPLEQLMAASAGRTSKNGVANAVSTAAERIALGQSAKSNAELSAWFEKLQVSEVRVETINSSTSGQTGASVKLTLAGNAPASSQAITAVLPSQDIRAFRLSKQALKTTRSTDESGGEPLETGTGATKAPAEIAITRRPLTISKFDIKSALTNRSAWTSLDGSLGSAGSETGDTTMSQNLQATLTSANAQTTVDGGTKVQFGAVRFTLPDNIERALQPNGKSLSIKIEPEHLGPARLNLQYRGDGLSARVTVDSPAAQGAIERSLDKLHDQLAQAGIKVDHLEVSLSGGQTRGQFSDQRPGWLQPQGAGSSYVNDYRLSETVTLAAVPALAAAQYVGSQGVNLFA